MYLFFFFFFPIYDSSRGAKEQKEIRIWKNSTRKFVEISKYLTKIIITDRI